MGETRIVLLSSVNVGGRNRISNAELGQALKEIGFPGARPVMQSGNLIVEDPATESDRELEQALEGGLRQTLGLEAYAFAYPAAALREIAADPPWPAQSSQVHLFVHRNPVNEEGRAELDLALKETEEVSVSDHHFWLHAPDGLARSKVAARASAIIGQPATARSRSSLGKILAAAGHELPQR